jgi:hypothetical protein
MCSMNDDPSMHDEPLEDTVDWKRLREIRIERETFATDQERAEGIPPRHPGIERWYEQLKAVEARRGWEYDPSERVR